ncbi:hypothetical protein [Gimesia fumaroli]|uniref:Uncharacterized protein n=1 Tax=Gimesia fumaroli TaxID=2527976 RepID=A0A518IFI4_9PLAN|nr:hypothetical protein [Gimesia fumaroli]QDV51852.1 hypothetical protein Enr17x_39110 [Gimesia fumaroli]
MLYLITFILLILIVAVTLWSNRSDLSPRILNDPLAPKPLETLFDKIDSTPDSPVGFGYKISWLAIKTPDAKTVLDTLHIENVQPANWNTGVIAAYNGHTFISPPINGWVLVVSYHLPELGKEPEPDGLTPLLTILSQEFGEVQYFGTHRVVEYHAWSRYINGSEIRAFAYLGESDEILANRGADTEEEEELGYEYFDPDSPDADSDSYWEREDLCYPDETHVMEVAGLWSVNPTALEDLELPNSAGWIGNLVDLSDEMMPQKTVS